MNIGQYLVNTMCADVLLLLIFLVLQSEYTKQTKWIPW